MTTTRKSALLDAGARLYRALGAGDVDVLRALLAEDFQGHLTAGLPHGFGTRTYDGRETMLRDGWGAVGEYFRMSPHVEQLFVAGDVLIGRGAYVGTAVPTGKPVRAAFAHFWRFRGAQIVSVDQVTDSALWQQALESASPAPLGH
jgi:2-(1,2-epoxy-1,2-dihydrophenyl)acetyl-CoA isomerase